VEGSRPIIATLTWTSDKANDYQALKRLVEKAAPSSLWTRPLVAMTSGGNSSLEVFPQYRWLRCHLKFMDVLLCPTDLKS